MRPLPGWTRDSSSRPIALAVVAMLLATSLSVALVAPEAVQGSRDEGGSRRASSPDEWLTFKADDQRTGEAASEAPSVGNVLWTANYRPAVIYSSPTVWNGTVYIGTSSSLRAIWAKNGTERWTYEAPNPIYTAAVIVDGIAYFGTLDQGRGTGCVAVNARTGVEVWNASIPDFVTSAPVVVGSYVYAGCQNGILYCLRKSDGGITWTFDAHYPILYGALAYSSGLVYFGVGADQLSNGKVFAVDADSGLQSWNQTVVGSIYSAPCVVAGSVLVGTTAEGLQELGNGYVYRLNSTTGAQIWRSENLGQVYASPSVLGNSIFVGTFGKTIGSVELIEPRMYCLDLSNNGDIVWSNATMHGTSKAKIWSSVAVAGTKIVFGDELGYINAWSILGRQIWSHEIGGGSAVKVSPAVASELIIAATALGDVVAFGSQPDLSVTSSSIAVSDAYPHLGQRVQVRATISNLGDRTAVGRVFLYNGSLDDWDTVINHTDVMLEPGRSTYVYATWTADALGNRAVWVRIMDVVPNEDNLSNNEAKRVLEVQPPAEGWLLPGALPSGTGFTPTEPPTNNVTKWLRAEGGTPGRGLVATRKLVLYPVSDRLVAMNSTDGSVVWSTPLGSTATTPPAVGDGGVFVGTTDGALFRLDLDDGTVNFLRALDGSVTAGPLVVGQTVYAGTSNSTDEGTIYALDTFDGRVLWSRPMGAAVRAHPVLEDGSLFAVSDLGAAQSLNASTGALIWQFPVGTAPGGSLTAAPIASGGRLYVASSSGFVYCLDSDPSDGVDEGVKDVNGSAYDLIWSYHDSQSPTPFNLSPALVDGLLVLVAGSDTVLALNASGGTVEWRVRVATEVPLATDVIAVNASVVVGGSALDILSSKDGKLMWTYDRPLGTMTGGPCAVDGMLFASDTRAIVYAFGKVKNIPPLARIKSPLSDTQARINESITFDATTTTDDKPLPETAFRWDFGDGNTSLARVTSHAYAQAGIYKVVLTITDTDSAVDDTSVTVHVLQNHAPTLDLAMVSPGQGLAQDTIFDFSVRYTDPDNDAPQFIVMRLANEPEYQYITLTEVDPTDHNYSDGKLYSVPKTLGSRPYPAVEFRASDGIATTETSVQGPRVLITRTFPNNVGDIEVAVTYVGPNDMVFEPVVSPPTTFPTSLFPIGLYVGLSLNTTYLQEATIAINYTFHDTTGFDLSTLSVYRWTLSGSEAEWKYIASSRVDLVGGVITAEVPSLQSDIYTVLGNKLSPPANRPPVPIVSFQDKTYSPGQSVSFDGSGSYDPDKDTLHDKIVDFSWDFGDGSSLQKGKNASHVFSNEGVYTVTLTVTDTYGSKNETVMTVTVRAKEEATTLLYLAIAGIIILIVLLFYPKGGYGSSKKGGNGNGNAASKPEEAPQDLEPKEAKPPNDKPPPGELDDIIDELEEDRGRTSKT